MNVLESRLREERAEFKDVGSVPNRDARFIPPVDLNRGLFNLNCCSVCAGEFAASAESTDTREDGAFASAQRNRCLPCHHKNRHCDHKDCTQRDRESDKRKRWIEMPFHHLSSVDVVDREAEPEQDEGDEEQKKGERKVPAGYLYRTTEEVRFGTDVFRGFRNFGIKAAEGREGGCFATASTQRQILRDVDIVQWNRPMARWAKTRISHYNGGYAYESARVSGGRPCEVPQPRALDGPDNSTLRVRRKDQTGRESYAQYNQ